MQLVVIGNLRVWAILVATAVACCSRGTFGISIPLTMEQNGMLVRTFFTYEPATVDADMSLESSVSHFCFNHNIEYNYCIQLLEAARQKIIMETNNQIHHPPDESQYDIRKLLSIELEIHDEDIITHPKFIIVPESNLPVELAVAQFCEASNISRLYCDRLMSIALQRWED